MEGEDPAGIAAAVTDYLTAAGWTVTREVLPGAANGCTTTIRATAGRVLGVVHTLADALTTSTPEPAPVAV